MNLLTSIRTALLCDVILLALISLPVLTTAQTDLAASEIIADQNTLLAIRQADHTLDFEQLAGLVERAERCCLHSSEMTVALTAWLRENHPIYQEKGSNEVIQFRAFLLARLGQFPPHAELLQVVISELEFGQSLANIAAAAVVARKFPADASVLVPLLNRYLRPDFIDETVDLTTYRLQFPVPEPTTARYEIIRTIQGFGDQASSAIPLLQEMLRYEMERVAMADTKLIELSREAISHLEAPLPACCQPGSMGYTPVTTVAATAYSAALSESFPYAAPERSKVQTRGLLFTDQEGRPVKFRQLRGKPFVLTFFYTQCTNPLKCASTLSRLAELQQQLVRADLSTSFGLYALSYDAVLDNPLIMKSYGDAYGLDFRVPQTRLLTAVDGSEQQLFQQLNVRVGFGHGTINHHGVQLFVFDRQGRIAAEFDNEVWTPDEVYSILLTLEAE